MTAHLLHQVLGPVRRRRHGVTLRQHVRRRLRSSTPVVDPGDGYEVTDLVSILSSLGRSLRAGLSLRQSIIETGHHDSAGVIHFLAQRLTSGWSLDRACADFRDIPTSPRGHSHSGGEPHLVIGAIELAQSMGGDEARLIDSLIHSLIERRQISHERQAQAATALASMRMLTWLPIICGLWIITESEPSRTFILHTAAGRLCLIGGFTLNLIGRVWARRIVTSA